VAKVGAGDEIERLLIRAAAAELPSVPLEDALDVCLAPLELEPDTYPRIATPGAAGWQSSESST
jgi:hypothetical protein